MTYNPFGATTYNLSGSISSTASSITLSSFLEPVTGTPYTMILLNTDIAYGTIAPKTTSSEFISFTGITQNVDGTATLTGVVRGLAKKYPFTTDSAYKLPHSGQTQFIISDAPQVFQEYVSLNNDQTIYGIKTFDSFPLTPSSAPITNYQVANKKYVDDTAVAGAPNASTTTKGIVQQATVSQVNAGTGTGSTGAILVASPSDLASSIYGLQLPTSGQKLALPGNNTDIAVGTGNLYVTQTGLQHNAEKYAADAGANDTYVITLSPVPTSYTNGMIVYFKANTANTGAATINVNSLGAKTIVKYVSTTLADGDIAAGMFCTVIYDGTNFVLQNPIANVVTGSTYTVNADESLNTYNTQSIPINGVTTTIYGWVLSTTTLGASSGNSAGGYVQLSGSGSADFNMITSLPGSGSDSKYTYDDGKIIRIKARLRFPDTSDRKGFGLVITAANIHTAQTDTTNGEIRFILNGASLYAQNANGTATSTDISSGITVTNWNLYEIVFTPGVSIQFYVNGVLKATSTTNLPSTGTPSLAYGNNANGRIIETTFPTVSIQN